MLANDHELVCSVIVILVMHLELVANVMVTSVMHVTNGEILTL